MRVRQVLITMIALLVVIAVTAGATVWLTRSSNDPTDLATRVESFRRHADDRQLTIKVTLGIDVSVTLLRFEERENQIVVTVRRTVPEGLRINLGLPYEITATLEAPVGTRAVVDGSSGEPVPEARQR